MFEPSQTLDLGEDIFGLGFHFELRQVALGIVGDAEPFLDGVEHLEHTRDLVFGEQPDMQRQSGAAIGLSPRFASG